MANLKESVKFVHGFSGAITDETTDYVDTTGFRELAAVVQSGASTAGGTVTVTVLEATDEEGTGAAEVTSEEFTVAAGDSLNAIIPVSVQYTNEKYVAVQVGSDLAEETSVMMALGDPREKPVQ